MKKNKDKNILIISVILAVITICVGALAYKNNKDYMRVSNNSYNYAFYELVDYMDNVENYLAKSLVTNDSSNSAKTLTYIWKDANLAAVYLAQIPIEDEGLNNTQKFLNQVSEYSYTLAMKAIENKDLKQEELSKLKELYNYSVDVNNTLNQIFLEISNGTLNWKELKNDGSTIFSEQVSNASKDSFNTIEANFEKYDGLIYDGAYSEHITNVEKKGLTGEEVDEEKAKQIAEEFAGKDNIKEINSQGLSENGDIKAFTFQIITNNRENKTIVITQKGGHILFMNYNRNVNEEKISEEEAEKKASEFLNSKGFTQMKKTYYIKENGIMTINYAYEQENVIIYTDLIKVKVALDNGEILGIETTGYLNNHEKRNIEKTGIITINKAMQVVNKDLEIKGTRLSIIPTEYKTEKFCWELNGKVEDREFLIYVNAKTGKVENVLVKVQTENGILTQ